MRRLPPLRAVQAFEATARLGSVKAAAAELGVTASAISHQIRGLEETLRVRLLHRAGRGVAISDAGYTYLQRLGRVFDRIEEASRHVSSGGASDVLTVHCPPSFAPAWLVPRLPDFLRRHPDIDVRLRATPAPPDFVHGDTDVEIRFGLGDWPGMAVHPIARDTITPMLPPTLARRLDRRAEPAALAAMPLIHSERQIITWSQWFAAHGVPPPRGLRGLRCDRAYVALQGATLGLGVALESTVFAARHLADGRLVAPFLAADAGHEPRGHHLVFPLAHAAVPKVALFAAWIEAVRDRQ
ncbi:LysR substrate-binding domain-containing protein [Elioraea sp.]|uniref:LysR substrate-binding domain-containing protein n=1 Tax=Elioraea sp. TaxID=2185103 RepID=UPI003F711E1F